MWCVEIGFTLYSLSLTLSPSPFSLPLSSPFPHSLFLSLYFSISLPSPSLFPPHWERGERVEREGGERGRKEGKLTREGNTHEKGERGCTFPFEVTIFPYSCWHLPHGVTLRRVYFIVPATLPPSPYTSDHHTWHPLHISYTNCDTVSGKVYY